MNFRILFQTLSSRFAILILNFVLVIVTTQIWGSHGRGVISLFLADLTVACFVSNLIIGSGVSYFTPRVHISKIMSLAYLWSAVVSISVPFIISAVHNQNYSWYLAAVTFTFSLLTVNINIYVGQNNLKKFNLLTLLQQLLLIFFIFGYTFFFSKTHIHIYFLAQIGTYSLLFIYSFFDLTKGMSRFYFSLDFSTFLSLFHVGWRTQISSFIQFLNNRLSYYFLEATSSIAHVGIFSVAIACSEAVLAVSRSLSIILYSDIVSNKGEVSAIEQTKTSLKISLWFSLCIIIVLLLIPSEAYSFIFGKDFSHTKKIIIYLTPGIVALATSHIVEHYFSASYILRILYVKAFIGLGVTIICAWLLIPHYGIVGASITTSCANIVTATLLFRKFYKTTPFSISDFLISTHELRLLWQFASKKLKF